MKSKIIFAYLITASCATVQCMDERLLEEGRGNAYGIELAHPASLPAQGSVINAPAVGSHEKERTQCCSKEAKKCFRVTAMSLCAAGLFASPFIIAGTARGVSINIDFGSSDYAGYPCNCSCPGFNTTELVKMD